jgi:hypothetical protein
MDQNGSEFKAVGVSALVLLTDLFHRQAFIHVTSKDLLLQVYVKKQAGYLYLHWCDSNIIYEHIYGMVGLSTSIYPGTERTKSK